MKTFLKEIKASQSVNGGQWEAKNKNGKRWVVVNEAGEQIAPEYSFVNKMEAEDFAATKGEFIGDLPVSIKTKIIELATGSKRYFVEVGNYHTFEMSSSRVVYTHAVIGKTSEGRDYEAFGFHSSLELAEKKFKKHEKGSVEIFIVEIK